MTERRLVEVDLTDRADGRVPIWRDAEGTHVYEAAPAPELGAWTTFTPTLTADSVNPTLGNGTLTGRYKLLDDTTMAMQITFVYGSSGTAAGTGTWHFALPAGVTAGALNQVIAGHVNDANVGHRAATAWIAGGGTVVTQIVVADTSAPGIVTHNAPWTWASGDEIALCGIIEIAP